MTIYPMIQQNWKAFGCHFSNKS